LIDDCEQLTGPRTRYDASFLIFLNSTAVALKEAVARRKTVDQIEAREKAAPSMVPESK
jgi:hypothetical protein